MVSRKVISIFGTSRAEPGSEIFQLAHSLGKALALAGFDVANGGYSGTMLAAAKGASEAGASVTGVTCYAFKRSKANEYVTKEVSTADLEQRLSTIISLGDGYVVLPGGTGTLLELAHVWELKNKHFIDRAKPVILLGSFWRPVVELVGRDDQKSLSYVDFAADPDDAARILKEKLIGI
ncbi:MAG: hypothetical protein A2Y07_07690 [Planctomycetes bacterium GWF2_50_10]|nr:MAG: hypothetical protein A2Y07_07690 [Planctomycetes bacterium GWF2_50_10]